MMVSAQTLAAFDDRLINLDLGQRGVEQLHATAPQPPLRCSEANLLDRQRASRRDNGMRTVSVDRREPVEPTPLSLDDGIIAALADRSLPLMELCALCRALAATLYERDPRGDSAYGERTIDFPCCGGRWSTG